MLTCEKCNKQFYSWLELLSNLERRNYDQGICAVFDYSGPTEDKLCDECSGVNRNSHIGGITLFTADKYKPPKESNIVKKEDLPDWCKD